MSSWRGVKGGVHASSALKQKKKVVEDVYSIKAKQQKVGIESIQPKAVYFVPHPTRLWVKVLVERVDLKKGRCHVRDVEENAELDLDPRSVPFLQVNAATTEDMTSLYHLHEPGILDNLEQRADLRYQRPYTRIANVLIAVNPLRRVADPEMESFATGQAPPHPWGVAETAFRQMVHGQKTHAKNANQSVVISGESGAGKTESAKIILAYLCARGTGGTNNNKTGLDRQLLDSNPILEALGNAKTFRNDNSSRFGKFLKLQFVSRRLAGASIETYLLERSRVIEQTDGERNFHALYQLVVGASAGEARQLKLPRKPEFFQYLNSSSCKKIENVDDSRLFGETRSAFATVGLGLSDEEDKKERQETLKRYFEAITRVLAAVLHLGNVTFDATESAEAGDRACVVSEEGAAKPALAAAVTTLGVDASKLEDLLVRHRVGAYTKQHDKEMAQLIRDGVAKEVYSRMFDAVVADLGAQMTTECDNFIGVLDIFGFESFKRNDIEQLLINFSNESLQATFNKAVLVAEQELYASEGIWGGLEKVEVDDATTKCVALIADRRNDSIFRILDEFTETAKTAAAKDKESGEIDRRFCRKLHEKLGGAERYVPPQKKDVLDTFVVAHYAADVKYSVGRFVAKNANEIPGGLEELLAESEVLGKVLAGGKHDEHHASSSSSSSKKKKSSLSAVFARQMNDLCEVLESTSCSFVRCIKPNSSMTVGIFEREFAAKQLRAQGILQTCDVLKLGMPTRVAFEEVEDRYRKSAEALLAAERERPTLLAGLDARAFTAAVLWSLGIERDAYSMGRTRVFFKTGKIALLDQLYSVDLESDDGAAFATRLRYFASRRVWRRALAKILLARALKLHWERVVTESRAVRWVQIRYKYYRLHGKGKKRRLIRRRWRIAYVKVRCLAAWMDEYRLIHETRLNRERLEREAAASVMEVKVAKRSASAILSEAVARGQISKDEGDHALDKMRAREAAKQKEEGVVGADDQNPLAHGTHDDDFDDDAWNDDATGETRPASPPAGVRAPSGKQEVESLLVDAAAAIENQTGVDEKVAAEVRKAMSRLKLAKATLARWMKVWLYRGWEKWLVAIKDVPRLDDDDVSRKSEDDSGTKGEKALPPQKKSIAQDPKVADAWLKADIRRAINELRDVLAKAPRLLKDKTDELNDAGLAELLDPSKELPEEDGDVWNLVFRPAGTGAKLAAERAAPPPPAAAAASEEEETAKRQSIAGDGAVPPPTPPPPPPEGSELSTLQQQIALLKKQLTAAGVQAVELIPLAQAREKMNAAVKRLMDGDMDAEKEVEKYDQIIRMHPDYEKEEAEKAAKWVEDTRPANLSAQTEMRKLVPPDVRSVSLADLEEKGLPQGLVRRLWTKKATWLVRFHPDDTAKLHIADLLSKYNNQGLDIVEMRAVWASLPDEFDNDGNGKKAQWKANFRTKLMELVTKEEQKRLSKNEKRNPGYKDASAEGYFDPKVPLVRAGITKSNPYAAQEKPVIKVAASTRFKAEKKVERPKVMDDVDCEGAGVPDPDGKRLALARASRYVAVVNGEIRGYAKESDLKLDKTPEFVLAIRGRGDDDAPGGVLELAATEPDGLVVTNNNSLKLALFAKSSTAAKTFRKVVADELAYQDPSKKMKELREMKKKAEEEARKKEAERGGGRGGGMPGGLMAAISGRGRGGGNPMLDGIKNRGRGGGRGSRGAGGNALLGAIQSRGRGAGGGRESRGGGGGLMEAIANRGRGGRASSRGGGRGRGGGSVVDAATAGAAKRS
ncbi:hypothetical protein CTAYLR_005921 [Chrysophaeum taylorii]|uniref:Myosin motor domain-containing protein n=1 Tax=Chrysophaeum taylorii TaxID=2483200 RepID=A0AAD7UBW9_9STRA|nr:hypothetical protein CTAYLR_005921 [Chrysophaeum taylorii]